jgi:RHS repeat-associated protein
VSRRVYRIYGQFKRRSSALGRYAALGLLLFGAVLFVVLGRPANAASGNEVVAYYGNWDIYQHNYFLKDVDQRGAAKNITKLIYSFENINPTTLQCFQATHPVDMNESNPNAGDGGGDAWGDYQRPFTAAESVNGQADSPAQALKGSFNQIRELKAKYPKLKVMVSVGGWTYSKFFSDAAATPASRAAFVSSCIDMYIRGNVPTGIGGQPEGGQGVAKGIFDGIDIDWEFPSGNPARNDGHTGNHVSANDGPNYAALMAEFRNQLTAQGNADHQYYYLSSAVPSGPSDINAIPVSQVAGSVDWVGVMSYDMHGAWDATGPTNFQAPIYAQAPKTGLDETGLSIDEAIKSWENRGMPASKIAAGIPFYWRGWTGVQSGTNYGFNMPATGPSPAIGVSNQAGVANYKELLSPNKLTTGNVHWDPISASTWAYDGTTFYTGDTPQVATLKGQYVRSKGLRGAMIYSLEGDDKSATMLKSVVSGLNGGAAPTFTPSQAVVLSRSSASSPNTATNGEPVNVISGNFLLGRHDLKLAGKDNPIDFALNYNSAASGVPSSVGWGWTHNYRITAQTDTDGSVIVQNSDGRTDRYIPNGSGGYTAPSGILDSLSVVSGIFKVTHKDRSVYNFNADGLIKSIVSPNNNSLSFTYDANNRLTTITNPAGRSLTLAYDDFGTLSSVTDNSGRHVNYTYDALGELAQVTNAAGQTTKYAYDANHQLTTLTDPRGRNVVVNVYDDQGHVTRQTNGLGKVVTLDYSVPNQTTYTDANGGKTVYMYDSQLRVTNVRDATGGNTSTSYDAAGNVYQTTDPLAHVTTRLYDSRGNLTSVTNPAGGVQRFTYDAQDNLLTRTDALNRITTYTYDSSGNVKTKTDPLGKVTTFAYNATGQLTAVTDPLNHLTGFVYDANGNLVTKTDPSNRNTYYGYDGAGRLTAVESHNLHETDLTLDAMDRVTKATDPLGHDTQFAYDADGNKTKATDANGHATSYTYDANNNLTKTTNPLLKSTSYEYDGNDNLVKKTDAKGHATTYAYDLNNRQTQSADPLGFVSKVTYDAAGNVATRTDASNRTTAYAYDNLNRLTTVTYPDATKVSYTYDAVGNLLTATNPAGTTTYTYDANDHVLTVNDPHSATITYTYNAIGSISTVKYPDNKTVTYTYTPSNQLSTVTDWNSQTTTYLYDNDAQLATKTLPNTIKATYTYDANGNLSTLDYKKGTAAFTNYAYTRDSAGNVTEEDETKANGTHVYNDYAYDAADQLTFNDAPTDTYHYTYDDVGNMATAQNASGTSTNTYDNDNRLTSKTAPGTRSLTYDAQGNEITDTGKSLGYNFDNQLKTYASGGLTTTYVYDATGNRIDKTQSGTGAVNYQYVNAGNNTVLQAKNLTAGTSQYYLYGAEQISQGDASSSSRQYPITDGMGTVRYLTNSSGSTVTSGTFAYDAYGKQISGSATLSNYMYQSEQKDGESSLIFLRARYYDPSIGRFTSQDPLGGDMGNPASQNGYNYANSNPINFVDPSGLSALSTIGDLSGLAAFQNSIAAVCTDWGGIALTGAAATLNLATLIPGAGEVDLGAQAAIRGTMAAVKVVKAERAAAAAEETSTTGSYVLKFLSGKTYDGKGSVSRMNASAKRLSEYHTDPVVEKIFTPAPNENQAFINEYLSLGEHGGPASTMNYNLIESPGKKKGGF